MFRRLIHKIFNLILRKNMAESLDSNIKKLYIE